MITHTLPNNLEAEQSVLGSILLDNSVFSYIEGKLVDKHFYKEAHRKIFRAIEQLFQQNEPVDLVTLTEALRQSSDLESVGSVAYLIGLAEEVPTAAYAEHYANIVAEKALLRELISTCGQIMQNSYDQTLPLEQILDKAEASIFELSSSKGSNTLMNMSTLVGEAFEDIYKKMYQPNSTSGLKTGFSSLDSITSGLQDGSLNVLAARPSMGKTALALTICQHVALNEGKAVGVFSLEMSAVQLVNRMICSTGLVDMNRVRNGDLPFESFTRLGYAAAKLAEAEIFIDDTAVMNVMELRSKARKLMTNHQLGLLVIDYLQLMSGGGKGVGENRQQEISTISRSLKALARELNIPVLALSQLSRAVESRPNKRPMLSDLRESGSIEQDADLVMFIYRDEYYDKQSEKKGIAEIIIGKQRNGPTGSIELMFHSNHVTFHELDRSTASSMSG